MRSSNSCLNAPTTGYQTAGEGEGRRAPAQFGLPRYFSILFAALLLLPYSAVALDPNRAMSQYLRDHWGAEQGFPHATVYSIAQTNDGYLWVGTAAGLIRFDGVSFRIVKDESGSFSIKSVVELAADREGCLWVRLQDLTLLRYCAGIFKSPSPDGGSVKAGALNKTNTGEILIAEHQQTAMVFRDDAFHAIATTRGLSRTPPTAMTQSAGGDLWIGTREAGVFRLPGGTNSPFVRGMPDEKINRLLDAGDGTLWIGTDYGVSKWHGGEFTTLKMPTPIDHFQVMSMAKDRDGNVWVGADAYGLLRINGQGVARTSIGDGGSGAAVTALFEDREGDLWVGTSNGLDRLRDTMFITYSQPEGLPTEGDNPVYVDSENRTWFSRVTGGLWWMKDGRHGVVSADGLGNDVVYSIDGRNGELWLGRQRGGLTRLHWSNGAFRATTYSQVDGLAQNSVFSVYAARDGSVWAGTLSGGVSRFDRGGFTAYTVANGLASNTVISILEGRDGTMWFATPSGLSALSNGHWQTFKQGLPSADVNCLMDDSNGVVWAGTASGLAFGGAGGFRTPSGVPSYLQERVLGIAEDRLGGLWLSTFGHVLRVNRERLMSGAMAEGDIREFGLTDGLRGIEGVKRSRSVVTAPSGQIWLSLNRGISSVDPGRLTRNSAPATVHIHSIWVDNSPVELKKDVRLPGGPKRITFGFMGLSLSAPGRVRYRFRLDGAEHEWNKVTAAREASYTNLGPGQYRFRVIASNPDGIWNDQEAAVDFRVDPLYWQTWWFVISATIGLILVVAAVYRMRVRQLTKRLSLRFDERLAERTRLARELHDTLLQTIQGSKMVADDGLEDPSDTARTYRALERVSVWLAQASQEGRAALAALRSSTTQRNDLAEAFERAGADSVLKESLKFELTVSGGARQLHPIVRDEVYRIGYEAIRNACCHSQGSRLDVELVYARDLSLRVRDNGIGIAHDIVDKGKDGHYGLRGMRERAQHIGAKLNFHSTSSGTEVALTVPGAFAFQVDGETVQGVLARMRRVFRLFRQK